MLLIVNSIADIGNCGKIPGDLLRSRLLRDRRLAPSLAAKTDRGHVLVPLNHRFFSRIFH